MKLVVAGSTGFVATEVICQALSNPFITSVVALGRRPAPEPQNADPGANLAKLKSVTVDDLGQEYPEHVKKELSGADACIWYSTNFHSTTPPFPLKHPHATSLTCLIHLLTYHLTVFSNRTIAITPSKSRSFPWEQTVRVCRDYAIRGIETISQLAHESQRDKPFRFVYISGSNAERDPKKKPWILGDYCLMRVQPSLSYHIRVFPSSNAEGSGC
jgi:hypothetical protein